MCPRPCILLYCLCCARSHGIVVRIQQPRPANILSRNAGFEHKTRPDGRIFFLHERKECVALCGRNAVVSNYDAIEKLLDYGITAGLRYKASEHPLLIVEDPFSFAEQRMKLAELMFEKLGFPAIYFIKSSSCIGWRFLICIILSFSLGKTTCMSVDFGASGIRVVPVYDGYPLMTGTPCSPSQPQPARFRPTEAIT